MDEAQILKALERRPLTIDNLAHMLGWKPEDVRGCVMQLWKLGYISTTQVNSLSRQDRTHWLLSQILPLRQGNCCSQQEVSNSGTYFILSSKGHYHLYPIFSFR
ncbi:MAG: hypothetical protein SFW36_06055 [Leptolyngbyaceae cyanobacterium bins.59]|nr:hypothetical protein [Leptolyngbyaceae cyanobacterium bins.59]